MARTRIHLVAKELGGPAWRSIERDTLRDPRLAPEELGVLCWVLSQAPDWQVRVADVVAHFPKCSTNRARRILRRLAFLGYAATFHGTGGTGRGQRGTQWEFWERAR